MVSSTLPLNNNKPFLYAVNCPLPGDDIGLCDLFAARCIDNLGASEDNLKPSSYAGSVKSQLRVQVIVAFVASRHDYRLSA